MKNLSEPHRPHTRKAKWLLVALGATLILLGAGLLVAVKQQAGDVW